jgi:hypothetical protein
MKNNFGIALHIFLVSCNKAATPVSTKGRPTVLPGKVISFTNSICCGTPIPREDFHKTF